MPNRTPLARSWVTLALLKAVVVTCVTSHRNVACPVSLSKSISLQSRQTLFQCANPSWAGQTKIACDNAYFHVGYSHILECCSLNTCANYILLSRVVTVPHLVYIKRYNHHIRSSKCTVPLENLTCFTEEHSLLTRPYVPNTMSTILHYTQKTISHCPIRTANYSHWK